MSAVPEWAAGDSLRVRRASDIEQRELEPLWPGVLWIGKPTLLAGDPGLGKSMVTASIAARVSTGQAWPCQSEESEPGEVLMLSAEDDAEDTIIPRLSAAGADLEKILVFEGIRTLDEDGSEQESWLSLDKNLDLLSLQLEERFGRIRLVIIDPISAFMGSIDSHRNSDVRAVLSGLARMASTHRAAVLVVSHLNKADGSNAMYRVSGSLAFTAAARAVYAVAKDPDDDDQRLVLPIKSNLGPDSNGFRYVIKENDDSVPYVMWDSEPETRSVEEVFNSITPRQAAKNERDAEVAAWLTKELANGPKPATDMYRKIEEQGFSEREVRRAKQIAGVKAEILGYQGAWHWKLS